MQSIDNVLKLRKGLKPDDPNPDIFDILWAKKLSGAAKEYTITGNPLSFLAKKAQLAKSTKLSMEPIQDLHGYDNPWPAGGGKNKFSGELYQADSTINTSDGTIISNSDYDVYILPTLAVGDYALSVLDSSDVSAVAKRAASYDTNDNLVGEVYAGNHTPSTTVRKGKVFTVPSGISYTLCSVRKTSYDIMVESGSTITDYTPYSNICPISGRTSVGLNGCGKNLFNKDDSSSIINANIPSGSSGTIPINANSRLVFIKCKPNTTYTVSKTAGARFRVCTTVDVPADGVACSQIISDNTASSITITTNATAKYLCSYVYNTTVDSGTDTEMIASVQIEQGSSSTAYESYQQSNDITITFPALGKNKFTKDGETSNRYLNANGEESYAAGWCLSDYIPISPNTTYTFNPNSTEGSSGKHGYFDKNKNFISAISSGMQTFTSPSNTVFMRFSYRDSSTDIQLEEGSTATTYEPYTNTVYGGTLDVETGVLTIDSVELKQNPNDWKKASGSDVFYYAFGTTNPPYYKLEPKLICNRYKTGNSAASASNAYSRGDKTICPRYGSSGDSTKDRFYVRDDDYATLEDFVADISSLQIVYVLPEPSTIQLTPEQIQILKGQNTIWIEDAGASIKLTYKA